ncbi:MAG TPA: hypothetical protein VKA44_06605, partial [Gemmatimonadota bacterium]|nr:hypothetical protein [Gemmatimonadota bacterium]
DSAAVEAAVDSLGGLPPLVGARLLGGGIRDPSVTRGFGAVRAAAAPAPGIGLRAGYASSDVLTPRALVRGRQDVSSIDGAVSLAYGSMGALETTASAARLDHGHGLIENVYGLSQKVRLNVDGRPLAWTVGARAGRWWDRDDWILSTSASIPLGAGVKLVPGFAMARTSGPPEAASGRRRSRETRGELGLSVHEPGTRWSVEPTVVYSAVTPLDGSEAGRLFEIRLRASVALDTWSSLVLSARHQSPPFSPAFTAVGFGVALGLR